MYILLVILDIAITYDYKVNIFIDFILSSIYINRLLFKRNYLLYAIDSIDIFKYN